MAPTTTQEEGGDGSASRARTRGWWRRTHARGPSPPTSPTPSRQGPSGPTASSQRRSSTPNPSRTGHSKPRASSQSRGAGAVTAKEQCKETKGSSAVGKEQSKKRKWTRATDAAVETAPRRSKRRNVGDIEAAAASASAATKQVSSSEASSAVSSPRRVPYIPRAVKGVNKWGRDILEPFVMINPAIVDAFTKHKAKYLAKHREQLKLVTLDEKVPRSCLGHSRFESIRESVTQVVLKVAKVVFGLSSYIDGNPLQRSSGFLIEWDKESKIGIILTSALLIRSKSTSFDEWLGTDEYAPHAEVHAHLLDRYETVVKAELIQYHKHYNFALFKIKIDGVAEIPSLSERREPMFGKEVLILGRDKNMHLSVDYGTVSHKGPNSFERNHYMFASCVVNQCAPGGLVIDLSGQFMGMVNLPDKAFTPPSIIFKCLHMLKKFDCIPRLHTGMKFSAIKFLDPIHREKIIRKCDIDTGLIITEVSQGSVAEKVGIRNGDILEFWNGEYVSTTVELESILLHMSEEHLQNGGGIGSTVDVPVGIFIVRQNSRRTIMFSLKVSDVAEVFTKGEYAITAEHCTTTSDDNDDAHSGEEGTPSGTSNDHGGGN